jgi:hypothetical protein
LILHRFDFRSDVSACLGFGPSHSGWQAAARCDDADEAKTTRHTLRPHGRKGRGDTNLTRNQAVPASLREEGRSQRAQAPMQNELAK